MVRYGSVWRGMARHDGMVYGVMIWYGYIMARLDGMVYGMVIWYG